MNYKKISAFFLLLILITSLGVYTSGKTITSSEILLIPLDSRPCNTDYIIYAAGAIDKKVYFPKEYLDDYNRPSNSDNLYKYLYDSLDSSDTYIIYTNQIINGGLISSRDPLSYLNLEEKLEAFAEFLKIAKDLDKKVIVLSVLPRVSPSQFTDLWNFKDELINFSNNFGTVTPNISYAADSLPPKEIIARYLSIYNGSDLIINDMKKNVESGLIDLFIIGQDDTNKESITNHQLEKYLNYQNEKIIVQPGADELTKLVLAKIVRNETKESLLDLNIIFTDPTKTNETRIFEAFSTEERSNQLLEFLSIKKNLNSDNIVVVHNKANSVELTINNIYNNLNKNYLGLIDIAYINQGDPELFKEKSFIKSLNGYSGWNTVGNSLGSEYANIVIYDFLQKNLHTFPVEKQIELLENYYKLFYIHFADDYLYQGQLRNQLNSFLLENNEDISFIMNKDLGDNFLKTIFKEQSESLQKSLSGSYYNFDSFYTLEYSQPTVSLPWKRTFEVRIIPNLTITKGR